MLRTHLYNKLNGDGNIMYCIHFKVISSFAQWLLMCLCMVIQALYALFSVHSSQHFVVW